MTEQTGDGGDADRPPIERALAELAAIDSWLRQTADRHLDDTDEDQLSTLEDRLSRVDTLLAEQRERDAQRSVTQRVRSVIDIQRRLGGDDTHIARTDAAEETARLFEAVIENRHETSQLVGAYKSLVLEIADVAVTALSFVPDDPALQNDHPARPSDGSGQVDLTGALSTATDHRERALKLSDRFDAYRERRVDLLTRDDQWSERLEQSGIDPPASPADYLVGDRRTVETFGTLVGSLAALAEAVTALLEAHLAADDTAWDESRSALETAREQLASAVRGYENAGHSGERDPVGTLFGRQAGETRRSQIRSLAEAILDGIDDLEAAARTAAEGAVDQGARRYRRQCLDLADTVPGERSDR